MSNWSIRRAENDSDWRTGLSLIVGHDLPAGEPSGWDHLLESRQTNQLDRTELLLAEAVDQELQGHCLGSLLLFMQSDRSASLLPPALLLTRAEADQLAAELLDAALELASGNRCTFAQSLIEPQDECSSQRFEAAGLPRIGSLLMMQRPRGSSSTKVQEDQCPEDFQQLRMEPLGEQHVNPEIATLLEQTYADSSDFPELVNKKDGAAGLATHRLQGQFDPNHWYCLKRGETSCGLAFLAWHADRAEWEVVYLGLRKEFRGRGWARYAIGQLLSNDEFADAGLFLGVDRRNLAAIRLYKSLGFSVTGEHTVHFRWLTDGAS